MNRSTDRTRVKICGLTRPDDAELAIGLGADFLGLNFWPGSSRCLEIGAAREIATVARGRSRLVGVFVNQERGWIAETADRLELDLIQLHGDEGPDEVGSFGARALKALRFHGRPKSKALAAFPAAWGFLVEAARTGAYGGVGREWNYAAARVLGAGLAGRPLLIAGGLGPENVRQAVAAAGAWGVDVASGVESAPGIKDRGKLEKFFEEVHHVDE